MAQSGAFQPAYGDQFSWTLSFPSVNSFQVCLYRPVTPMGWADWSLKFKWSYTTTACAVGQYIDANYQCQACQAGVYCAPGAAAVPCTPGYYCAAGADRVPCNAGYFCPSGSSAQVVCPAGAFHCAAGASAPVSIACAAGYESDEIQILRQKFTSNFARIFFLFYFVVI